MMMRKSLLIIGMALVAAMACSCNHNDKMIDRYERAIAKGEYEDAMEILDHIDEDKLTREQSLRILNISTDGAASAYSAMMLKAIRGMGGAMNQVMSSDEMEELMELSMDRYDEAVDDALDGYDRAVDEAMDRYDRAVDDAVDRYDRSMDDALDHYDRAMEAYEDAVDDAMDAYEEALDDLWD